MKRLLLCLTLVACEPDRALVIPPERIAEADTWALKCYADRLPRASSYDQDYLASSCRASSVSMFGVLEPEPSPVHGWLKLGAFAAGCIVSAFALALAYWLGRWRESGLKDGAE